MAPMAHQAHPYSSVDLASSGQRSAECASRYSRSVRLVSSCACCTVSWNQAGHGWLVPAAAARRCLAAMLFNGDGGNVQDFARFARSSGAAGRQVRHGRGASWDAEESLHGQSTLLVEK